MDSNLLINEAVAKAVDVCNCSAVKRAILNPPTLKKNLIAYYRKDLWDEDLESKARSVIIERNYEPQETIMGLVHPIARRMLSWATYHESVIAIPRACSYAVLQPSVFTPLGLIDSKRIVKHLITSGRLSTEQRYRLACMYCLKEDIATLHREMSLESRKVCYQLKYPNKIKPLEMVIFWSRSLSGEIDSLREKQNVKTLAREIDSLGENPNLKTLTREIDSLRGNQSLRTLTGETDSLRKNQSLYEYRLEKAVESANLTAVEFCLKRVNSVHYKNALLFAAIKTVKNKLLEASRTTDEESIFSVVKLELLHNLCDYYNDILYLLLSKMSSEDQRNFLRMDIDGYLYGEKLAKRGISRVLQCFLYWPYQAYFMQIVRKMWDFLPEKNFADILLSMCGQLKSEKGDTHYGENRAYDYKTLIKEFWCESDDRFKRYVFKTIPGRKGIPPTMKAKELLVALYSLRNITLLDRDNIKIVLDSATDGEKRIISQSKEINSICCQLIIKGNWEVLNEFIDNMHRRKEEADTFRRSFILSNDSIKLFRRFLKSGLIGFAQTLIEWGRLPEEEQLRLKRDTINSNNGMMVCIDLVIAVSGKRHADRICRWCFAKDEDISDFKQRLIFSENGMGISAALVTECKFDQVDGFVNWCLSEEVDIAKFKKILAYEKRDFILTNLFTNTKTNVPGSETLNDRCSTARWVKVERFLTWCFQNEEEISDFKRAKMFSMSMREIHFHFIKSEQWKEAEKFFLWLEMSKNYVQQLKILTLFNYAPCLSYFTELASGVEKDDIFDFLRWFLKNEETARAFQAIVEEFCKDNNKCVETFNALSLLIEEYVSEMREENKGGKRKSKTFSPSKKLRSSR